MLDLKERLEAVQRLLDPAAETIGLELDFMGLSVKNTVAMSEVIVCADLLREILSDLEFSERKP